MDMDVFDRLHLAEMFVTARKRMDAGDNRLWGDVVTKVLDEHGIEAMWRFVIRNELNRMESNRLTHERVSDSERDLEGSR